MALHRDTTHRSISDIRPDEIRQQRVEVCLVPKDRRREAGLSGRGKQIARMMGEDLRSHLRPLHIPVRMACHVCQREKNQNMEWPSYRLGLRA